jgi:hypothetical protein
LKALLFRPQKSVITQTVWFFLGIIKVGAAYAALLTFVKTPIDSNLAISSFVMFSYALGIVKGLP